MKITLYSKPNCVQCTATKRALDKADLPYEVIDITQDALAYRKILALGFMQAPVVETSLPVNDTQQRGEPTVIYFWSGFRPDLIDQLAEIAHG